MKMKNEIEKAKAKAGASDSKKPDTAPGKKPATVPKNKAGTGATKSTDDIIKEVMNRNKSGAGPADATKAAKAGAEAAKAGANAAANLTV